MIELIEYLTILHQLHEEWMKRENEEQTRLDSAMTSSGSDSIDLI